VKGFQHALTWNSLMKLTPCVEAVISTPLSLLLVLGTSYVSEHVESEHDRDHVYPCFQRLPLPLVFLFLKRGH